MLPASNTLQVWTPPIDALFTATSALSVTGLVLFETGTYFSLFGQLVILFLIQVGGIGIISASTIFALATNRRIGYSNRLLLQEEHGIITVGGIVRLTKKIILSIILIELVATLILGLYLYQDMGMYSFYFGFFHSVSALMNAGFDITGHMSFSAYAADPLINTIMMILIIGGGLGYIVLLNLWRHARYGTRLITHTKLVLLISTGLILFGTGYILLSESRNPETLGMLPHHEQVIMSLYQSVNTRTAGFFSMPISEMFPGTLVVLIVLMFIGASPGSAGGGIKTTTFAVLLLTLRAFLRGKSDVEVLGRRITPELVMKAFALTLAMIIFITLTTLILIPLENKRPLSLFFETISAYSTVGLSTGITPSLSPVGKVLIGLSMIIGRLGPLTFLSAFILKSKKQLVKLPSSSVNIG
jgi:trk system potassium uptake protein